MITTSETIPAPLLTPYVRCYVLREFNTDGKDLTKPWNALQEVSMFFFFKAKPVHLLHPQTRQVLKKGQAVGLMGLSAKYNGEMTFNGCYKMFEIIFKANGFYKLFGIPNQVTCNCIIDAKEVLPQDAMLLFEQLSYSADLHEMSSLANSYLLSYLTKNKFYHHEDVITKVCDSILKSAGLISVDKLAYKANMSLKTFERHFKREVGLSPKLFSCITRFNHAFELKLKNPQKGWTSISAEAGYFDQMHLIKDFKRFAGNAPTSFIKQTPLTEETFTNRVKV